MHERFEYVLDLPRRNKFTDAAVPEGLSLRTPGAGDLSALAELMLEAYRDTIDYAGETIVEATDEIRRYLGGDAVNRPLLEPSVVLTDGTTLASACLVACWTSRDCPLVSYVITHPLWKRRGLAKRLVAESLSRLATDGHSEVRAMITKGNLPSERLFVSLGFAKVNRA